MYLSSVTGPSPHDGMVIRDFPDEIDEEREILLSQPQKPSVAGALLPAALLERQHTPQCWNVEHFSCFVTLVWCCRWQVGPIDIINSTNRCAWGVCMAALVCATPTHTHCAQVVAHVPFAAL